MLAAWGSVWARAAERALASWPCQHAKGSDFPPGGSFLSTRWCSPGPSWKCAGKPAPALLGGCEVNKNQLSASLCPRSVFQVSWFQHKSYKICKLPVLKRCTQPLHLCSAGLHARQCCSFSLLKTALTIGSYPFSWGVKLIQSSPHPLLLLTKCSFHPACVVVKDLVVKSCNKSLFQVK